jgi:predicted phosphate transport protein (TIGR00153 family)
MPGPPLGDLFGRSPFRAMQRHMDAVVKCVDEVVPLFEAAAAGDVAGVRAAKEAIDSLEQQADKVKTELRSHLPKGFFLPVARRDILEILDLQDTIADRAQDIADLLVERRMVLPTAISEPMLALVRRCHQACRQAGEVIAELDELLEMSFRGREASRVVAMVGELDQIEDETDALEANVNRLLFAIEGELDPVSVIFWYRIIELTGDLADYAKKVGSRLRLFLAT